MESRIQKSGFRMEGTPRYGGQVGVQEGWEFAYHQEHEGHEGGCRSASFAKATAAMQDGGQRRLARDPA
jgi:hypothetical protein